MVDISKDPNNIWWQYRHNHTGFVQWSLIADLKVQGALATTLGESDSAAKAVAIKPAVSAVGNCVGQLGVHEERAIHGRMPYLEPQDGRWSIFRVLPEGSLRQVSEFVVEQKNFELRADAALKEITSQIRKGAGNPLKAMMDTSAGVDFFRQFLVFVGSGIGAIVAEQQSVLAKLFQDLYALNEGDDSPLYKFERETVDRSLYGLSGM